MVDQAELAEGDVEVGAPGAELGVVEIQSHRDVRVDVDELRHGRRDGYGAGSEGVHEIIIIIRDGAGHGAV